MHARTTPKFLAAGILAAGLAAPAAAPDVASAQGGAYQDFQAMTAELRALADGSAAATMRSIGETREGRDIWVVEIGDPDGAALDSRPGLLIVGNLEGDHVVGSALAVEIVRHLLGGDAAAADMLAERVVYVVPRLNPDAAEAMFATPRTDRARNALPYDDDNDGRVDEDPAEDLNGDGVITVMRVPDAAGEFTIDTDDPRLMKRADRAAGESGTHALHIEGRDSDGDDFLNEDGPGGVDLNRNFQHAYPYWQADAGPHMVSEPETRALMDFVVAHRNIAAILAFGHSDNLVNGIDGQGNLTGFSTVDLESFAAASNEDAFDVGVFRRGGGFGGFGGFGFGGGGGPRLRGAQPGRDNDPASGRRPATSVNRDDREYYGAVAEAYREITGIARVGVNRRPEGAFFDFGYFQFGVPSFTTQGWGFGGGDGDSGGDEAEEGSGRRGGNATGDAALLAALEGAGIDAFVDWTPFAHPDLGDVEIGGFRPYAATNPPADRIPELGRQHGEFVVRLASMLPRVAIVDTSVTGHGGGVFTVTAEIENSGYFPTALEHGVDSRSVQQTMVQIQVDPDDVLTGDAKTSTIAKLDGSGGRASFTWVIRGSAGDSVEILVRSQKGGSDSATVTLR